MALCVHLFCSIYRAAPRTARDPGDQHRAAWGRLTSLRGVAGDLARQQGMYREAELIPGVCLCSFLLPSPLPQ